MKQYWNKVLDTRDVIKGRLLKNTQRGDLPGGPVVKTLLAMQGPLLRERRPHCNHRALTPQPETLHTSTETCCSQINTFFLNTKKRKISQGRERLRDGTRAAHTCSASGAGPSALLHQATSLSQQEWGWDCQQPHWPRSKTRHREAKWRAQGRHSQAAAELGAEARRPGPQSLECEPLCLSHCARHTASLWTRYITKQIVKTAWIFRMNI